MKKIVYIFVAIVAVMFTACEKSEKDISIDEESTHSVLLTKSCDNSGTVPYQDFNQKGRLNRHWNGEMCVEPALECYDDVEVIGAGGLQPYTEVLMGIFDFIDNKEKLQYYVGENFEKLNFFILKEDLQRVLENSLFISEKELENTRFLLFENAKQEVVRVYPVVVKL